jgi:ABC-type branched-subunit amino acid transport system substrate-binding protein
MRTSRLGRRCASATAIVAALATGLAACSSSDSSDSAADTPAGASANPAPTLSGDPATGEVFKIGWASMDEGQIPLPGFTDGALAAVKYINAHGGIAGRPVELVTCSVDSTPEKNQACGQQFANDDSLNMAMMGISTAGGPYYSALESSGLPILGISPVTPSDFAAPSNTVFYSSGGAGTYFAFAKVAESLGAKSVAYLQLDNTGGQAGLASFREATKDLGLDIRSVAVSSTATDVLPQLTQVDAVNADLVVVGVPNCLPFAKALRTLGVDKPVISVGSCFSAATIGSDPDLFEGWYDPAYIRSPLEGPGQDDVMDTFLQEYPKHANLPADPLPANSQDGWAGILTLRMALESAAPADLDDKAKVQALLQDYPGPMVLGPETLDCANTNPDYPSVCTLESVIEKVEGGRLVPQDM